MNVDDIIVDYGHRQPGKLWPLIVLQFQRGGKRMRPQLCLDTHRHYGGHHPQISDVAASWEMLHLGLLMHDDIMDVDYLRHDRPNLMGEYYLRTGDVGLARNMAILAGDLCIAAAFDLQRRASNSRIMDLLQQVMNDVIEGQRLDVTKYVDPFETARLKTASYSFVGPMLSGAILAGAGDVELQHLREKAERLGVAYQMENGRNDIGHDQAAGRVTTATVWRRKA